jgi:hypothetical protein
MKKIILLVAILITSLLNAQIHKIGTVITNKGGTGQTGAAGTGNANVTQVSTLAELQGAATNATIEIIGVIDCLGGAINVSTKNFTLIDGGGLITNFTSFNIGDFHTEGNPNATYFDQSSTIQAGTVNSHASNVYVSVIGQCLDEVVYVNWFSPNKNANLVSGGTLNGALSDHISIQNAIAVTPKDGGTIAFPINAKMLHGDGTNPEYPYTQTPYIGAGTVNPDTGTDDYIGTNQGFVFENFINLKILGNGSTLLANPNQSNIVNNKAFQFLSCDDTYIENLTYDGNVVQRDMFMGDRNPFNLQHAFSFNGCLNPILFRITAINSVMDGFYFGLDPNAARVGRGGTMTDCKALYCYRQGLTSNTHSEMSVYNCEFSFTGKRISTVGIADGRYLTTSPSAGVDMEGGGIGTQPEERGQFDWIFSGCKFESNYGAGLSVHWGSTRTMVTGCLFVDTSLFEPQDSVEETTGNNSYLYNTFYNSTAQLEGGGAHFIGNIFFTNKFSVSHGLFSPAVVGTTNGSLVVLDPDNHYTLGYSRQTIIKNNLWKNEVTNANFPAEIDGGYAGLILGKITVSVLDAVFEGNTIINALGIKATFGDETVVSLDLKKAETIANNVFIMTPEALTKYPNNVGRMFFNADTFKDNDIHTGYTYTNIYFGGLRGTTANIPTAGGVYDSINAGAEYYDTTTNQTKYWNGTSWIAY